MEKIENGKSLREQVYGYFCKQMKSGKLSAGHYINQSEICKELNVSKAPLRDALIQLETEGFVSILPRKGVIIKPLTPDDVIEAYEVLGALESEALRLCFHDIKTHHLDRMERINAALYETLETGRFSRYYKLNEEFHNVFLDLKGNGLLKRTVVTIKQRLYDFPLRNYVVEWERINLREHKRLIVSIGKGNVDAAASIIKHEHWCAPLHESHIREFYRF